MVGKFVSYQLGNELKKGLVYDKVRTAQTFDTTIVAVDCYVIQDVETLQLNVVDVIAIVEIL